MKKLNEWLTKNGGMLTGVMWAATLLILSLGVLLWSIKVLLQIMGVM